MNLTYKYLRGRYGYNRKYMNILVHKYQKIIDELIKDIIKGDKKLQNLDRKQLHTSICVKKLPLKSTFKNSQIRNCKYKECWEAYFKSSSTENYECMSCWCSVLEDIDNSLDLTPPEVPMPKFLQKKELPKFLRK